MHEHYVLSGEIRSRFFNASKTLNLSDRSSKITRANIGAPWPVRLISLHIRVGSVLLPGPIDREGAPAYSELIVDAPQRDVKATTG